MPQLRLATQTEHQRIERSELLSGLLTTNYSMAQYQQLLARLFGFYSALEPQIFTGLPEYAAPVLMNRQKSDLLVRDLQAFSMNLTAVEALPRCFTLPELKSFAARMGSLYVMEGATLGGQIIQRKLIEQFGVGIQPTLYFYSAYGDDTGRQWYMFKTAMEQWFGQDNDAVERLITSARATFNCLIEWLEANN